jgi:hypothetical protein
MGLVGGEVCEVCEVCEVAEVSEVSVLSYTVMRDGIAAGRRETGDGRRGTELEQNSRREAELEQNSRRETELEWTRGQGGD